MDFFLDKYTVVLLKLYPETLNTSPFKRWNLIPLYLSIGIWQKLRDITSELDSKMTAASHVESFPSPRLSVSPSLPATPHSLPSLLPSLFWVTYSGGRLLPYLEDTVGDYG